MKFYETEIVRKGYRRDWAKWVLGHSPLTNLPPSSWIKHYVKPKLVYVVICFFPEQNSHQLTTPHYIVIDEGGSDQKPYQLHQTSSKITPKGSCSKKVWREEKKTGKHLPFCWVTNDDRNMYSIFGTLKIPWIATLFRWNKQECCFCIPQNKLTEFSSDVSSYGSVSDDNFFGLSMLKLWECKWNPFQNSCL